MRRNGWPPWTVLLLLSLAGCGGLAAGPKSPLPDIDAAIDGTPGLANSGLKASYTPDTVNACFAQRLDTDEARRCRDTIVQALTTAINLRYAEYELGFFDANRYGNFAATVAVLGLGAAGSLTSGGAPQVFSGLAAAVTGTRAAFNREVLQEQTAAGLLTLMRSQRNQADLRIRSGLRRTALEYPLGVALSDVYALYRAGTIPGALAGFTQAAGVQGQLLQDDLAADTGATTTRTTTALALVPAPFGPDADPAGRAVTRTPARPAALRPARVPAQPFGHARTTAAVTLRAWLAAPGLSPAEARDRRRRVQQAAADEGVPDVTVASFVQDESPDNLILLDRVARRLGLVP